MSLNLWLPGTFRDEALIDSCHVIVDGATGEQCGVRFYAGEEKALQTHVIGCARRHIDEIRGQAPSHKHKGTFMDEEAFGDPEVQAHMLRVGRRMLKDGDYTVHPNERAGF